MRKLLLLLVLFAVAVAPIARATSFTWVYGQRSTQTPVEQQTPGGALQPDSSLWVVNPYPAPDGCVWDADDRFEARGNGSLSPGESTEWHECLLADHLIHIFDAQVYAKGPTSDQLVVEVGWSNADAARSLHPAGVPGAQNSTNYDACFAGPEYDHDSPLMPPVEGSNGGVAQPTDVFVRVTNTSSHTVRDVFVITSLRAGFHPCPNGYANLDNRIEIVPSQMWWFVP